MRGRPRRLGASRRRTRRGTRASTQRATEGAGGGVALRSGARCKSSPGGAHTAGGKAPARALFWREVAWPIVRSVAVQPWSYGTRSCTVVRRSNAWNVKTNRNRPTSEPSRGVSRARAGVSRARGRTRGSGGAVLSDSVRAVALSFLSSRHWGLGRGGPDDVARRTKPHDTLATTLAESGCAPRGEKQI